MKILVTGDRKWVDTSAVEKVFLKFKPLTIIEGEASGLDSIARDVAVKLNINVEKYPANWKQYKKAAGPIRNIEMLKQNPDIVLAFHDNLKNSKGTKHCVLQALKLNIQVYLISHENGNLLITKLKEYK